MDKKKCPLEIILITVSTHRDVQCVFGIRIGVSFRCHWGRQVIIRETLWWTIVGNAFWECHIPCTSKNSLIDFEKRVSVFSRYKRLHFSSLYNSPYFSRSSQKLKCGSHVPPSFLYSFEILLNRTFSFWICMNVKQPTIVYSRWNSHYS